MQERGRWSGIAGLWKAEIPIVHEGSGLQIRKTI